MSRSPRRPSLVILGLLVLAAGASGMFQWRWARHRREAADLGAVEHRWREAALRLERDAVRSRRIVESGEVPGCKGLDAEAAKDMARIREILLRDDSDESLKAIPLLLLKAEERALQQELATQPGADPEVEAAYFEAVRAAVRGDKAGTEEAFRTAWKDEMGPLLGLWDVLGKLAVRMGSIEPAEIARLDQELEQTLQEGIADIKADSAEIFGPEALNTWRQARHELREEIARQSKNAQRATRLAAEARREADRFADLKQTCEHRWW